MARHGSGAWTIGEHLAEGTALTAYCNNPRCARAKRRQGRALDLTALDPALTLEELQARLACVDCGHRQAILIRTPAERDASSRPAEHHGSHRR
jgi:hypothetical protein